MSNGTSTNGGSDPYGFVDHSPGGSTELTTMQLAGSPSQSEEPAGNGKKSSKMPSQDYHSRAQLMSSSKDSSLNSSHWTVDKMDKGIRLVVHDVSCKIGEKDTVQNVTGVVEPGEFYAIMGPSGAGKSMLLDIVCFRKSLGKIKGAVLYNEEVPSKDFVQHNVAYVEQQITIQSSFTVEEAIIFSAMLKRPRCQFSKKSITKTVNHVIEQLGLERIRKSRIGNSRLVRGISGGESRRVSIGVSLVQLTKPGLLCLDEPTTGLDSAIGNDILKLVRGCSDEGWTIFTTIHNPSTMMMDHIDGLVLLVASKVIWFGPYNLEAMKSDFEARGFECGKSQHIVEYLLQVVGGGSKGAEEGTLSRACEAYRQSSECGKNRSSALEYVNEAYLDAFYQEWRAPKKNLKKADGKGGKTYANTVWREIGVLLKFRTWTLMKDPNFVLSRLLIFVLQALVFATFWANREKNISGLVDTIAVLFAMPISLSLPFGLFIPELFNQRAAFIREQHEGCYRTFSYCVSVLVTEFSMVGVGSILYTLIIYFALGTFPMTVSSFFFFMLNTWVIALNSVLFANLATNLSKSMEIALLIAPCYWLWNALVMGFITKYENMPVYYAWTYWISYLQYGFYGAMLNQFQGEEWNMCSSLNSGTFSLQTIIDALTTGEITQVATNLLNEVQTTVQDATAFDFPFQLSDAYCAAANQTDTTLPKFLEEYLPDQNTLKTFLPLLPTFLNAGSGSGEPKPKCNELCLPVPGSQLLEMYGMNPEANKWGKLGIGLLFLAVHFTLMFVATMHAKHYEKR
eukprot:CAMPEP_0182606312 /NCGR_PEP_ID=MMETSP1330-20130603/1192_1 /TAXON_ID=464278 /ORGANISM="Picochlorum sp., Strain RCC944" /LENGTH=793 /DNA_ID=CAMNT_0024824591 /DNA_START=209 /DNA_END=2590 /DNA_ORIENTATION=-